MTVRAPAMWKARRNPITPSPALNVPPPVLHAESTAHSRPRRSRLEISSAVRSPLPVRVAGFDSSLAPAKARPTTSSGLLTSTSIEPRNDGREIRRNPASALELSQDGVIVFDDLEADVTLEVADAIDSHVSASRDERGRPVNQRQVLKEQRLEIIVSGTCVHGDRLSYPGSAQVV